MKTLGLATDTTDCYIIMKKIEISATPSCNGNRCPHY